MDAGDRPDPPAEFDRETRAALAELAGRDAETLRHAAAYLEALAEHAATSDDDPPPSEDGSYPDGVPDRATVSTTEVGDASYRYYQWREGDEIRSRTERL